MKMLLIFVGLFINYFINDNCYPPAQNSRKKYILFGVYEKSTNYTIFWWLMDFHVFTSVFNECIKYSFVRLLFLLIFIFSIKFFLETILQAMTFLSFVSRQRYVLAKLPFPSNRSLIWYLESTIFNVGICYIPANWLAWCSIS